MRPFIPLDQDDARVCDPAKKRLRSREINALLCAIAVAGCGSSSRIDHPQADVGSGTGGSADVTVGSGTGGSAQCDETVYQGKTLPPDLLVVLKISGVVTNQASAIEAQLSQFASSPEASGVGFGVLPFSYSYSSDKGDPSCDPSSYYFWISGFDFAGGSFDTLPGAYGGEITQYFHLDGVGDTDTAMAPAMSGAATALTSWALNHPDQNGAIALVSDSEAASGPCMGTAADVAQTAAAAASGKAAIRTHVVTLGSVPALDAVAAAGGSVAAHSIGVPDLGTTLSKVSQQMRACVYSIPIPSTGSFDPAKVNVHVQGTADLDRLAQVPSAADCAGVGGGWHYDDPTDPRKIVLCQESCADLGEASKGIDVLLGCPTVETPK